MFWLKAAQDNAETVLTDPDILKMFSKSVAWALAIRLLASLLKL